jgi:hypothetical protein
MAAMRQQLCKSFVVHGDHRQAEKRVPFHSHQETLGSLGQYLRSRHRQLCGKLLMSTKLAELVYLPDEPAGVQESICSVAGPLNHENA